MSRLARHDLPRVVIAPIKPPKITIPDATKTKNNEITSPEPIPLPKATIPKNPNTSILIEKADITPSNPNLFTRIDSFVGPFDWLNLAYPSKIFFKTDFFPSALHALLIAQYQDIQLKDINELKSEKELLAYSNNKQIKESWQKERLKIMEQIQRDKFRRNEDLQIKLKETGSREIFWNNKNDLFFGHFQAQGQNHLGRILQEIRKDLKQGNELEAWLVYCHEISSDKSTLPIIKITENKEGSNSSPVFELRKKAYYIFGKLSGSDIVALNPSISRKHALITCLKDGQVLLFDLKSKAKTYLNGASLEHDHIGYPLTTGDTIVLGTSSRKYFVEIDHSNVVEYLERRNREISREIEKLSGNIHTSMALEGQRKIFVGGLSFKTSEDDLRDMFGQLGTITSIILPQSQSKLYQNQPSNEEICATRGIAFIEFNHPSSALAALDKNGRSLNGRLITVNPAESKPKLPSVNRLEEPKQNSFNPKEFTGYMPNESKSDKSHKNGDKRRFKDYENFEKHRRRK